MKTFGDVSELLKQWCDMTTKIFLEYLSLTERIPNPKEMDVACMIRLVSDTCNIALSLGNTLSDAIINLSDENANSTELLICQQNTCITYAKM
jgi:hypothetical protein